MRNQKFRQFFDVVKLSCLLLKHQNFSHRTSENSCDRIYSKNNIPENVSAEIPFLISHQGANFDFQGRSWPLGTKLTPRARTLLSHLLSSRVCSHLGVNEVVAIPSNRGQTCQQLKLNSKVGPTSN
jgi:hypothetical protein